MDTGDLILLLITMGSLAALPSASTLLVITRSISWGTSQGIATAIGVTLGDITFLTLALLGISTFLSASVGYLTQLFQFAAACYLLWLGINILAQAKNATQPSFLNRTDIVTRHNKDKKARNKKPNISLTTSTMAGLLVTLADFKAIAFYSSFLPSVITIDQLTLSQSVIIVVITFSTVGLIKISYALLASRLALSLQTSTNNASLLLTVLHYSSSIALMIAAAYMVYKL